MNPVLFEFGPISIYWYSIFILIAILLGSYLFFYKAKKIGLEESFYVNLVFYGIIIGVIGARFYYVLFNLDYYLSNPLQILAVWNGGLAIHGGIIAGLIWFIYYSKKHHKNVFKMLDLVSPSLILGQAIGRWGNFFNSEAHGPVTTKSYLENIHIPDFIINGMKINGKFYEPTFFYESIFDFIGFILLIVLGKSKKTKTGIVTATYLIWYSVIRFIIESSRTDSLMLGSIKVAKLVSIFLLFLGILIIIYNMDGNKTRKVINKIIKKIKIIIKKIIRRTLK